MAKQTFTNNATTTTRGYLSGSATTLVVNDSSTFPVLSGGDWFVATLDGGGSYFEIVKVTATTGTTWTIVRAQENTTAKQWQPNSRIDLRVTANILNNFAGQLSNVTIAGGTIDGTAIGSITPSSGVFTTLAATSFTLTNPLAVAYGGTGATTATAALTNLGAAPINSPPFTGVPTAPTATIGTNTTQLATTAYAVGLLAAPTPIGSTTPNTGAFTMLSASSTVSGAGFSTYLASPPAIGGTAAAAGTFTNLTATGTLTGFPGRLLNTQTFTASGTYTPTTGTNKIYVLVVAGGGAGGGAQATAAGTTSGGSGGSGGSIGYGLISSGFSGASITVGLGGTGVSGAAGNNGGNSSFGALITTNGGIGGGASSAVAPPNAAGGIAGAAAGAGGSIFNAGGSAGTPYISLATTAFIGGNGGSGLYGAGAGVGQINNTGTAGTAPGAGGGGATNGPSLAARAGANGANGIVIVYEYA